MRIGVLALQGNVVTHGKVLQSLGVDVQEVRKPQDLTHCHGLIIPGGESTVMLRRLEWINMREPLVAFARQKPLFGTCAGLILMAKEVDTLPVLPLQLLDIAVERNAFGRQVESFQTCIALELIPGMTQWIPAFFIRAPRIKKHGKDVHILATFQGEPILVRQGNYLGASFHPELTAHPQVHQYFIHMVQENRSASLL